MRVQNMHRVDKEATRGSFASRRPGGTIALVAFYLILPALAAGQNSGPDWELEAGVAYTDNINRAPDTQADPAKDDVIYSAGLNLDWVQQSRRMDADVRGSLFFLDYENNNFKSETLAAVDATLLFRLREEVITWLVQENYGQQIIDQFQPVTPDNRENISFFTTGPRISIPLGSRTFINLRGDFSDINYESRPLDNQRFGSGISLERDLSVNRTMSINVDGDRIEYDNDLRNPPIERYSAYLGFNTEAARNELDVDIGWNEYEQAGKEGDGLLADLTWTRRVSQYSNLSLNGGTRISSDGDIFRFNQQLDNDRFGDTDDLQSVSDPFQHDYARLSYNFNKARTRFGVRIFWDLESYESQTALDRTYGGATLDISRELARSWRIRFFGRFVTREYDNVTRQDDDWGAGAEVTWKAGIRTSIRLQIERFERSSNESRNDYAENRAGITFVFSPSGGL